MYRGLSAERHRAELSEGLANDIAELARIRTMIQNETGTPTLTVVLTAA
jgi:hypothetical protein